MNVSTIILLGPPNLPLVGSYPFFYKKNSLSFSVRNLVKNYGPVSGFFIGSQKVVVIADFEIMKSKLALNQVFSYKGKLRAREREKKKQWVHVLE